MKDEFGVYCTAAVVLMEKAINSQSRRYKDYYSGLKLGKSLEELLEEPIDVDKDSYLTQDKLKPWNGCWEKLNKPIFILDPFDLRGSLGEQVTAAIVDVLANLNIMDFKFEDKVGAVKRKHFCTDASNMLKLLSPILPNNEDLRGLVAAKRGGNSAEATGTDRNEAAASSMPFASPRATLVRSEYDSPIATMGTSLTPPPGLSDAQKIQWMRQKLVTTTKKEKSARALLEEEKAKTAYVFLVCVSFFFIACTVFSTFFFVFILQDLDFGYGEFISGSCIARQGGRISRTCGRASSRSRKDPSRNGEDLRE